jgi:hypothetical protein
VIKKKPWTEVAKDIFDAIASGAAKRWKTPTHAEIQKIRRDLVTDNEVGDAKRVYEAELRSGWDSYHTIRAVISGAQDLRQVTTIQAGAIEAARAGNVTRLVDCLSARKPLSDDDRDRLAAYIAMKKRPRLWSPELVRALSRSPTTDDEYDLLADVVAEIGQRRGGVLDKPAHRVARLAEVLLSCVHGRVRHCDKDKARTAVIEYASEIEAHENGTTIDPERVRNILDHPKTRGHKR